MKKRSAVLTFDKLIKKQLLTHLELLRFKPRDDGSLSPISKAKSRLRKMHDHHRQEKLRREVTFVKQEWPKLRNYFADGCDVNPQAISPRLELVKADTWQSNLFRLASLGWRVPVSSGYGRRIRFLVWDESNGKLIGLIGLGDPVFNMRVRDQLIGWSSSDRESRLVNVMDAYVLGALPPYNMLLGGKLIAALLRTKEIRRIFAQKYRRSKGVISKAKKKPSLVLVTTTSALGRSSVFNRVTLDGDKYLQSIGYTSGWGHFHIPDELFQLVRRFLSGRDHKYANGNRFGDGPNWKIRALRHTLKLLGLDENLLKHGIEREVFICRLAQNWREILCGKQKRPSVAHLKSVKEVGILARNRWIIPRADRCEDYKAWRRSTFRRSLNPRRAATRTFKGLRRYGTR
ncbi:MAG TPA: Druantia anti-phage system protein DruA [Candidatus Angelobacter sp.]|nr:Druantia anti-phage system protein DruA [Candidatus Angelobacter sp.]